MPGSKPVLIIDDDPILLEVLKTYFQARGAEDIATASDGKSAIELIDKAPVPFALISCDINMPDCDGIEFLNFLKERSCNVPLIIVTSASDTTTKSAEIFANAYGLNFLGLVRKPVRPAQVDAVLGSIDFDNT